MGFAYMYYVLCSKIIEIYDNILDQKWYLHHNNCQYPGDVNFINTYQSPGTQVYQSYLGYAALRQ